MAYTRAGGSYIVARDNFGPRVAQIAAAALLIDYVVTVAVQAAAGTVAVVSAIPVLGPYDLYITLGVVLIICYAEPARIARSGLAVRGRNLLLRHHDRPDDRGRCHPRNLLGATDIRSRAHSRSGAGPSGNGLGDGRDGAGVAARVRQRRLVADGGRGDLQHSRRLPKAAGPQRAPGAHRYGHHSRALVGGCRLPCVTSPTPPRMSPNIHRCCRRLPGRSLAAG